MPPTIQLLLGEERRWPTRRHPPSGVGAIVLSIDDVALDGGQVKVSCQPG